MIAFMESTQISEVWIILQVRLKVGRTCTASSLGPSSQFPECLSYLLTVTDEPSRYTINTAG